MAGTEDLTQPAVIGNVCELLTSMKKIMAVDDDKDLVFLLRHVLKRQGYSVTILEEATCFRSLI